MRTWQAIDPGTFNRRVTFCRQGEVEDGLGQITNGLVDVCSVWCDFYPVRGREYYEIQRIQGETTHKCYTRCTSKLADIDNTWFLRCGGVTYEIETVINVDGTGRYYEIYCKKKTNAEVMPYDAGDSGGDGGSDVEYQQPGEEVSG